MENKYSFKAFNFRNIEVPRIQERKDKDWVSFGEKNLYPDHLIEMFNTSAIHHTCVQAKTDATYGEGILTWGNEVVNSHGETMNEVFEKVVMDYNLFGGYALNVIWSKDGSQIAEYYHVPFNNVRSGKMNDEDKVDHYYYCSDWKQYRKYKPVEYRAYSLTDNTGDDASQIYYYYDYTVGQDYYPLPQYVAASNDIDIDARVSRFHSSNLANGLSPSLMLTFRNGTPSEDEMDAIWRDINDTFGGEENAGRAFINFAEPGKEPVVEAIQSANDDYYVTLEERISSRILTAHRITSPLLLGIKDSAGFSSNAEEIRVSFNHFLGTVIIPDQKKLLKSFGKIVRQSGLNVELKIKQADIVYQAEELDLPEQNITTEE